MQASPPTPNRFILAALILIAAILACNRSMPIDLPTQSAASGQPLTSPAAGTPTRTPFLPPTLDPNRPVITPTPNQARVLPTPRSDPESYIVQGGDSLGNISKSFGVSVDLLLQANPIPNPNLLEVGQVLIIPPPKPVGTGPSFKIIPDSELVYGPYSAYIDYPELIRQRNGFLANYEEEVDSQEISGTQVVQRVAMDYSVNPLLLLSVLEYQGGWINASEPISITQTYPMGVYNEWRQGLYNQLAWAANELNRGYYLWKVNALGSYVLADGTVVEADPTINAGTAAVQHLFSQLYGLQDWGVAVSPQGLFKTYSSMFGYPFDLSIDPIVPPDLEQPAFQLPFEPGNTWSFTGGPHGGWGNGSAWAGLDFAPPGEPLGCVPSISWVVAIADGPIIRAANGSVVQDLDGDGLEQTGWTILYLHIDSWERVKPGTMLKAGDRIGHPSCEGGVSTGTHVHIARRYNGEWIPADQSIPFVMDNWVSSGTGIPYNGYLEKGGRLVEAYERRSSINQIQR